MQETASYARGAVRSSAPFIITPADPSALSPFFTTLEVARALRVSQKTVQVWVRSGALPAMRYGRLIRIRQADLAAFGQALGTPAPPSTG